MVIHPRTDNTVILKDMNGKVQTEAKEPLPCKGEGHNHGFSNLLWALHGSDLG